MKHKQLDDIKASPENWRQVSIGDFKTSNGSTYLKTTLGSCVAVVLYSSKSNLCSMSHFLLPKPSVSRDTTSHRFKYGSYLLIEQINRMGNGNPSNLKAKIAGGASMFKNKKTSLIPDIGLANIELARLILNEKNISITGESVGGVIGRSIIYFPEQRELKVTIFGSEPQMV